MTEKLLYNNLKKALKCSGYRFELQRHEDSHSVGIPDCSYSLCGTNGWIEFKHSKNTPKHYKSKLRDEQKTWLVRHGIAGGNCYVLHQIKKDVILYNYSRVYDFDGRDFESVVRECDLYMIGGMKFYAQVLLEKLSNPQLNALKVKGVASI